MVATIKQYEITPVGRINLKRTDRAKRIRLQVRADGEIYVTMPLITPASQALAFVQAQSQWILQQQQQLQEKQTIFKATSNFSTKFHQLKIVRTNGSRCTAMVGNGLIQLVIPMSHDIIAEDTQSFIRKILIQVIRNEAAVYLPARTKELADLHQLKIQTIRVKNVKTRWGSCSSSNNINLNIHLMRLPDRLIDYVILHELAHTLHKHHQADFWNYLEKICPGATVFNNELKYYRTELF